jgi:hypothetical protein
MNAKTGKDCQIAISIYSHKPAQKTDQLTAYLPKYEFYESGSNPDAN